VWRVGLAWRLAVFYLLLAVSPLLLLAAAQYHHAAAATGRSWTDVGEIVAGVALLNSILLILFAADVNQQTRVLLGGWRKWNGEIFPAASISILLTSLELLQKVLTK
jgi:hypothetical protein